MEIIRTFHPIGQGAFYSEQFISKNKNVGTVIYDCGSNNLKVLQRAIPGCFCGNPDIDILFVSHFDADHINGISTLKKHYKINRVILPLIKPEDKILYKLYYRVKYDGHITNYECVRKLIDTPEEFFREKDNTPALTFVKPIGERSEIFIREEPINFENLSAEIESYTVVSFPKGKGWVYIPFNYAEEERIKSFKKSLKSKGIFFQNLDENLFDPKQERFAEIKKVYEDLPGGINANSLMLYSGIDTPVCHDIIGGWPWQYKYIRYPFSMFCDKLSGCLYLGDSNMNDRDMFKTISHTLSTYSKTIGLIQIPHHGSINNYNPQLLDLFPNNQCYVLSYGTNNSFGHPAHAVINSCLSHYKLLEMVNENVISICLHKISF